MSGVDLFRAIASSLPDAAESAHCGHPDFRAHGRIFATLSAQATGRGVLKLTTEQQAAFIAEMPHVFEPVARGWGRMGMTYIALDRADEATMRGALATAHRNIVAKHEASRSKRGTKRAIKRR